LTVGSTASITFTATDESGNLTVGGAVSEISKTTGTTSLALTVSGTGFSDFTWIVDGRSISASENGITLGNDKKTLTIDATDPAVRLGGHSVTVSAKKGGVPWSPKQAVSFTVKR
jgi:hypothetical protein